MNATQTATTGTEVQSATRSASATEFAGSPIASAKTSSDRIEPASHPADSPATDVLIRPEPPLPRKTPSARQQHVRLAFAGCAVVVILVYTGSMYLAYTRSWVKTDNAYLAAHVHTISSRVAGTVKEVLVDENQTVAQDRVLARLDARDLEVARQQALAQTAQARAQFQEA